MKELLSLLQRLGSVPPELERYLQEKLKQKSFNQKEFILKKGEVNRHIYFLQSGMIRIYFVEENGHIYRENINWILPENEIFISVHSFFEREPSEEYIQAVENCVVWYITRDELDEGCRQIPAFADLRDRIKTAYYSRYSEMGDLRRLAPKVRYIRFVKKEPWLLTRISPEDLASYLNMSYSTLKGVRRIIKSGN